MKAILLNSGLGSRMGDLTKNKPKCLIEIRTEETILSHQLKSLINCGIKQVIVTTGPSGDFEKQIKEYIQDKFPKLEVDYVLDSTGSATNYIYTLWLTRHLINDEIILMHGDVVYDEKALKNLLSSEHQNAAILNNLVEPPIKDFKGKIENGCISEISVNVFGENCFFLLPVYKLSEESFKIWLNEMEKFIKKNEVKVYAENAFNVISNQVNLKPVYYNGFAMEIDDATDLEIARNYFKKEGSNDETVIY